MSAVVQVLNIQRREIEKLPCPQNIIENKLGTKILFVTLLVAALSSYSYLVCFNILYKLLVFQFTCYQLDLYTVCIFLPGSPRRYERPTESPNQIGLAVGEKLKLSEHILAYPKGNVTWMFRQDTNSSETEIQSSSVCSTFNIFEHHICFVKDNLTEKEFGLYSAVVVNVVGNATFRYTVTPQGKLIVFIQLYLAFFLFSASNCITSCSIQ